MRITRDDLQWSHQAESLRRSVAMLQPGQTALKREDAMVLLERLVELLMDGEHQAQ